MNYEYNTEARMLIFLNKLFYMDANNYNLFLARGSQIATTFVSAPAPYMRK